MGKYVWLFPLLFIFHDMEEIIGFGIFLKKNKRMLDRKYPFVIRTYEPFSTEGIAFGVFEQFAVCLLFCILALLTDSMEKAEKYQHLGFALFRKRRLAEHSTEYDMIWFPKTYGIR